MRSCINYICFFIPTWIIWHNFFNIHSQRKSILMSIYFRNRLAPILSSHRCYPPWFLFLSPKYLQLLPSKTFNQITSHDKRKFLFLLLNLPSHTQSLLTASARIHPKPHHTVKKVRLLLQFRHLLWNQHRENAATATATKSALLYLNTRKGLRGSIPCIQRDSVASDEGNVQLAWFKHCATPLWGAQHSSSSERSIRVFETCMPCADRFSQANSVIAGFLASPDLSTSPPVPRWLPLCSDQQRDSMRYSYANCIP